jgi:hypothetical protein
MAFNWGDLIDGDLDFLIDLHIPDITVTKDITVPPRKNIRPSASGRIGAPLYSRERYEESVEDFCLIVQVVRVLTSRVFLGRYRDGLLKCLAFPSTDNLTNGQSVVVTRIEASTEYFYWEAEQDDFPIGGIVIWSGSVETIPAHFALCDGTAYPLVTTPDLRDRFIIIASDEWEVITDNCYGGVDDIDGTHSHYLGANTEYESAHTHDIPGGSWGAVGPGFLNTTGGVTSSSGLHSHPYDPATTTSNSGHRHGVSGSSEAVGDPAIDNRPPFYALCYIMRVD